MVSWSSHSDTPLPSTGGVKERKGVKREKGEGTGGKDEGKRERERGRKGKGQGEEGKEARECDRHLT